MTTNLCKQAIIDHIKATPGCIKRLWDPKDQASIDETELQNIKVWKRDSKTLLDSGCWERFFRATGSKQDEVADQVTATVVTDTADEHILEIFFEG